MPKKSSKPDQLQHEKPQRLQRVLAAAGFGSRRECEEYILEGRVQIDNKIVDQLGTKVIVGAQKIYFDGQRVTEPKLQYFMLNKPPGVVSTARDPAGRTRVVDLIKSNLRVYNVGRLDKSSEGLILVTNDGDLANQLTHPRFGVEKKYNVLVAGYPSREELEIIRSGVYLAEAFVKVANVRILKKKSREGCWLEIILDEGRNREIRRLLARIGHKVLRLVRVAIGPLNLGDLPIAAHRKLTFEEIATLKRVASGKYRRGKNSRRQATKSATKKVPRLDKDWEPAGESKSGGTRKKSKKSPFRDRKKKKSSKKKSKKGESVSLGRAKGREQQAQPKKKSRKKSVTKRAGKKSLGAGARSSRKTTGKRKRSR